MNVTISLEGLRSLDAPETRVLADIAVTYNSIVYNWQVYIPTNTTNLGDFLQSISGLITADIDEKEAIWAALTPKTRTIDTGMDSITVAINKSEIVKATIPDYYALRRAAYPSILDQIGALWKGPKDPDYIAMQQAIETVKNNIPKKS
jgi:hypothetical protein